MMNSEPSALARLSHRLQHVPAILRRPLLNAGFAHAVPFTGTAGLRFRALDADHAQVELANRRRVQNHIHGIHAAAMALLAETATGAVFALNLPAGYLPLLKTLHIDYLQRAHGTLSAVATVDAAMRTCMQRETRGELHIPVILTDASGENPARCDLVWAWVPQRRPAAAP